MSPLVKIVLGISAGWGQPFHQNEKAFENRVILAVIGWSIFAIFKVAIKGKGN